MKLAERWEEHRIWKTRNVVPKVWIACDADFKIIGVFSSEPRAKTACRKKTDCYASVTLDHEMTFDKIFAAEWKYPKGER